LGFLPALIYRTGMGGALRFISSSTQTGMAAQDWSNGADVTPPIHPAPAAAAGTLIGLPVVAYSDQATGYLQFAILY
jgi:hypothetical protein